MLTRQGGIDCHAIEPLRLVRLRRVHLAPIEWALGLLLKLALTVILLVFEGAVNGMKRLFGRNAG